MSERRRFRLSQPPLLQYGFRPFFLLAAVWALVASGLWLVMFAGWFQLPSVLAPIAWHGHEMVFGYAGAVIAGFFLTAIPNWTGRLPVAGAPLAALALLWLAARIANAGSALTGWGLAAALDVGFLALLWALGLREIVAGRNWRNLRLLVLLALLVLACLASHIGAWLDAGPDGARIGVAAVLLLIAVVGGRIVPSFTRNWLVKRGAARLPAPFGRFDGLALAVLVVAMVLWLSFPDAWPTAGVLLLGGIVHGVRLLRWRGWQTGAEPLVTILHLGYAWLPVGLLLLALVPLVPALAGLSAMHALTAGTIGTMTLAVMTRATLGHTGRALQAGPGTVIVYAAVVCGAGLRVLAGVLPGDTHVWLMLSGVVWLTAFGVFIAVYGPMLVSAGRAAAER